MALTKKEARELGWSFSKDGNRGRAVKDGQLVDVVADDEADVDTHLLAAILAHERPDEVPAAGLVIEDNVEEEVS